MSDVMQHPDAYDGPGEPKPRPEREAPKVVEAPKKTEKAKKTKGS
jgi:hypothetical protein